MGGESRGVVLLERWGQFAEMDEVPDLAEIFAEDVVYRDVPMRRERRGLDQLRELWKEWAVALPGRRVVRHFVVGDDNHASLYWTCHGREQNTGRVYEVPGVSVARLADGKIVEQWDIYDGASFFQQIGRLDEFVAMVRDPEW